MSKMIKDVRIMWFCSSVCLVLVGFLCGIAVNIPAKAAMEVVDCEPAMIVSFYEDYETGVNYVCLCNSRGNAITPRLNADGSLYVG